MSQNDQTAVFYVVELWTDIKPNVSTSSLKGNFLLDAFNPAVHPEVALFLLPWEDKINAGLSIKPRRWSFLTRLSDQAAGLIDKHPTTKLYVDTRCKLCSHKSDLHQISRLQLTDWTFLHLNPPKTDFSKRCYHLKLLINRPDCLPKAELQLPRTQMRLNSVV